MLFTNIPEVLPSWPMEAHTSGSLWLGETTWLVLVTEVHLFHFGFDLLEFSPSVVATAGLEMWIPLLGPPSGRDLPPSYE